MNFQIIPVGEQALNLVFPEKIDVQENRLIHQIAEQLKTADWPTIIDLIPAYHTLTINYNVEKTDFEKISQDLKVFINSLNFNENSSQKQRVVEIPVCYGDKFGPDLMAVAEFAQMSPAEVVKMHTSQPYYVYFLGFLPGFAYAGFVPDKIAMPRLQQPRLQLAAGSVGIAGKQTGMYPVASPGGWRIIGQTPLRLYDSKNPLPPYHAGDWLQFNSVSSDEFYQIQQAADSGKYSIKTHLLMTAAATRGQNDLDAAVEILNPGLAATIQDSGRWGYQRYGVSVSGAIDQFALHLANVLVGNNSDQAAIEFILLGPKLKFNCPTFIALTGGNFQAYLNQQEIASNRAYQVFPGDILSFDPMKNGRFGYVAFAGGIKTTAVLASRSTTSRIRLGGLNGATLTAGDFLPLSPVYRLNSLKQRYCQLPPLPAKTNLRFIRGPQWDSFSVSAQKLFCQQHFQVSNQADRMGYRLTGVKLPVPTQSMLSEGTVTGSVQVTRSGQPIVLLADRQTAGGYPVIATICAVDLPRLVQLSSQQTFGFTEISISQATELLRQQHAFLHQLQQRFYQQRYQLPLGPQQAAGQRISQLFKH